MFWCESNVKISSENSLKLDGTKIKKIISLN